VIHRTFVCALCSFLLLSQSPVSQGFQCCDGNGDVFHVYTLEALHYADCGACTAPSLRYALLLSSTTMLISSSHKGCLRPTGPRSARYSCLRLVHGHTGAALPCIGPQHHLGPRPACSIVRANVPRDSSEPVQQQPEESTTTHKVSVAARQLLSVTALAFFSVREISPTNSIWAAWQLHA
jgi:hypothetical protein